MIPAEQAAAPAAPALTSRARPRRARLSALVRLLDARLRSRLGAQLGRAFAVLAGAGYAIGVVFAARAQAGDASVSVVGDAIVLLSWIAGGAVALSAAGRRDTEEDQAIVGLARQQGYRASRIALAGVLAVARRVFRVVGIPVLLLCLLSLALAGKLGALPSRIALLIGGIVYVHVLAAVLAVLVKLSRSLSSERPRLTLVALVLLPELLRGIFSGLPSVPSLLGGLLEQVLILGGRP